MRPEIRTIRIDEHRSAGDRVATPAKD